MLVVIFFLLNVEDGAEKPNTWEEKLKRLNVLGVLVLIPAVVCLCLALQWGGTTYAVSATFTTLAAFPCCV